MTLAASFKTARGLLAKLERDYALMKGEVSSDRFLNFVVTAYSLCDWIKNDPSVPAAAKVDLQQFRAQRTLLVCRDVANANKHFEADGRSVSRVITDRVDYIICARNNKDEWKVVREDIECGPGSAWANCGN